MKLKALDQHHVSSVQADSLRPGQEFEIGSAQGKELLKRYPAVFELVEDDAEEAEEKAESNPENKAIKAAPANKAKKGK